MIRPFLTGPSLWSRFLFDGGLGLLQVVLILSPVMCAVFLRPGLVIEGIYLTAFLAFAYWFGYRWHRRFEHYRRRYAGQAMKAMDELASELLKGEHDSLLQVWSSVCRFLDSTRYILISGHFGGTEDDDLSIWLYDTVIADQEFHLKHASYGRGVQDLSLDDLRRDIRPPLYAAREDRLVIELGSLCAEGLLTEDQARCSHSILTREACASSSGSFNNNYLRYIPEGLQEHFLGYSYVHTALCVHGPRSGPVRHYWPLFFAHARGGYFTNYDLGIIMHAATILSTFLAPYFRDRSPDLYVGERIVLQRLLGTSTERHDCTISGFEMVGRRRAVTFLELEDARRQCEAAHRYMEHRWRISDIETRRPVGFEVTHRAPRDAKPAESVLRSLRSAGYSDVLDLTWAYEATTSSGDEGRRIVRLEWSTLMNKQARSQAKSLLPGEECIVRVPAHAGPVSEEMVYAITDLRSGGLPIMYDELRDDVDLENARQLGALWVKVKCEAVLRASRMGTSSFVRIAELLERANGLGMIPLLQGINSLDDLDAFRHSGISLDSALVEGEFSVGGAP